MTPAPTIRIALLLLALAACADRAAQGTGPRGTALPPPDPVTGQARTALPAR